MILRILNIHRIKELRGCPRALYLIDKFVGKTLGFEMELKREKYHQVFRYYADYVLFLVCQKVCIWDYVHEIIDYSEIDPFTDDRPIFQRITFVHFITNTGTIEKSYSDAREMNTFRYDYLYVDFDVLDNIYYLDMYKYIKKTVCSSYIALFHPKKSRLGCFICNETNKDYGDESDIGAKVKLECNCYLCNHLQVV